MKKTIIAAVTIAAVLNTTSASAFWMIVGPLATGMAVTQAKENNRGVIERQARLEGLSETDVQAKTCYLLGQHEIVCAEFYALYKNNPVESKYTVAAFDNIRIQCNQVRYFDEEVCKAAGMSDEWYAELAEKESAANVSDVQNAAWD